MAAIHLLIFSLLTFTSNPVFSLPLRTLNPSPNFDSGISLLGDAQTVNSGSSVQLTYPAASSYGLLIHTKPFKFLKFPTKPTSFSTDFSFSISPHSGDGLALVIVPANFPQKFPSDTSFGLSREFKFLGIEFDTSMDANVGDENANHVGIDVCSLVSVKVSNVSSLNLVLNSGLKLQSWIDYDASSKRLEVRLSEMGKSRPYNPLIAFPIDLSEMWKAEEVLVGISSSTGHSAQVTSVYSWKFRVRSVPNGMHSLPVDPTSFSHKGPQQRAGHKSVPCYLNVLSGLLLAVGCGAFVAFMVLFLREIWREVLPLDCSLQPANFRYKKVSVVVENGSENVKS